MMPCLGAYEACLNTFCKMYNIDAFACADELFNFTRSFEKFECSFVCQKEDDDHRGEDDDDEDGEYNDGDDNDEFDDVDDEA